MSKLFESGKFFIGCNYWASHAGTSMWSDWREDVVEKDFALLKENGVEVIRVFPLWPDFQPLTLLRGGAGRPMEYRMGEEPLNNSKEGQAAVSKTAMEHFEALCNLAEKYGFKLIVGLITGWMSGRLFVPPALESRNVFNDPVALLWQSRFVKYFVERFKNHTAIAAWDLGNECNCMNMAENRETAWVWTSAIVNAIRSEDRTKPIVSGMHGLDPQGVWTMQDQGELTDILTTHPYPLWTPYCDYDPLNTMRPIIHAAAESLYYGGIGKKPCFAEELGTMGPMMGSYETAGDFIRGTLFNLWAHDCRGMLWWCAFDQKSLSHAPYDWMQLERELGFIDSNGQAKPMLKEIKNFKKIISNLPIEKLPERKIDGVCIVSHGQEHWPAALGTFALAKQGGLDITYVYQDQDLPESNLYIMPCICGHTVMYKRNMDKLLQRVHEGATLYMSWNGGFIADFEEITGLKVITRQKRQGPAELYLGEENIRLSVHNSEYKLTCESTRAHVLGYEYGGNPAFTVAQYGKGKVYFLSVPVELEVIKRQGVLSLWQELQYYRIYEELGKICRDSRVLRKNDANVGITEHPVDENHCIAVLVNYEPETRVADIQISEGWKLESIWYGEAESHKNSMKVSFNKNGACIVQLELIEMFDNAVVSKD